MKFIKKCLTSKNVQLALFVVAFVLLYTASNTANNTLGYAGMFVVTLNTVLIILTK